MRTAIRRSLCLGFFLTVGINSLSWGQGFGGIRGQVVDSDFGQPIARSSVVLLDTPFGAMTDDQGNFTISGVPPGAYSLNVRSGGYIPKLIPGVTVSSGTFSDIRVETIAEVEEMEEQEEGEGEEGEGGEGGRLAASIPVLYCHLHHHPSLFLFLPSLSLQEQYPPLPPLHLHRLF